MSDKFRAAIVRHEKAKRAVDSLTRDIGIALGRCPLDQQAGIQGPENPEFYDLASNKSKTHLWHAFKHLEPSSCGWGSVPLCEDGISDALSEGSEFECAHCYHAYRMIVARKKAKQELGRARLAIRSLGRKALEDQSHG